MSERLYNSEHRTKEPAKPASRSFVSRLIGSLAILRSYPLPFAGAPIPTPKAEEELLLGGIPAHQISEGLEADLAEAGAQHDAFRVTRLNDS